MAVTTSFGEVGMGRSAGAVTTVSDVGDVAITTCVGNAGMGKSYGDVTAVAYVYEVAVTIGDEGTGIVQVT